MLVLIAFTSWRTAQATAILRRGMNKVAADAGMIRMKSGPARAPLIAPSLLRTYGLRSAAVFVISILALGAGTFMLREAATVTVIGARKGYAGDNGPAISAWLDTPGGIAVAPNGSIYFADSNNDVIRRIDPNRIITTVVGSRKAGFEGDAGPASKAQLDTPDGVAIAPDGDLIVADSHNDRIRRVDRATGTIITIAGSGANGYDGDDKPAIEAALNTPNAVAAAPNGDIYIADTLNYRIRMIDHTTGYIHTVAGDGTAGESGPVGDDGLATGASLNMPSDVAVAPNGDIYIADMHHNRIRKVDAATHIITTVAGDGSFGVAGDGGPAVKASLAGPAGIALVPSGAGKLTIYIADYYNGLVRAVGPDGIIRNVSEEGRVAFGAPSRLAFDPRRSWLYVADASKDQIVALKIVTPAPKPSGRRAAVKPATAGAKAGGE
jgi:sugar lactone lactonase YvrE